MPKHEPDVSRLAFEIDNISFFSWQSSLYAAVKLYLLSDDVFAFSVRVSPLNLVWIIMVENLFWLGGRVEGPDL